MSSAQKHDAVNQKEHERQMDRTEAKAKEQRRQQAHQANLQRSERFAEGAKAQYLDKLMETGMSDAGINLLEDNMVDPSFVLGNIDGAEYHDIKWQMRAMYVKIKSNFPPEGSAVTGDLRAFIWDDPDEAVEPLSGQQRVIIAQMIRGIMMRVSRSKDGFQQEMNVKSISVSEVMEGDEQEDDSLKLGLFG